MTVYIDHYPDWLGVPEKWKDGGHLFASSIEELHNFARSLGLKRAWYQCPCMKGVSIPHYDLTKMKRVLAIYMDAEPIDPGVIPEDVVRNDPDCGHTSG